MEAKALIREFLEDNEATRYSDEVIDELILQAIEYIARNTLNFRKTLALSSTKDGYINLPNNLGIVKVLGNCDVEVKSIVEVECECDPEEVETIEDLQYLIAEEKDYDTLRLCPKVTSLAIYSSLQDVIINTTEIQLAEGISVNPETIVITYKTIPTLDEVPESWKMAIVYFVTGTLLRFDKDVQNLNFGNQNLQLCDIYTKLLGKKQGF